MPSRPRIYTLLAFAQAADAVACALPAPFVTECLDGVQFPRDQRWIFAPIKGASAIGLASVWRFPALARFSAVLLTVYFSLAVGSHVRVRDFGRNFAAASTLLLTYGVLAATSSPSRTSA
jgi:DoxX-like family